MVLLSTKLDGERHHGGPHPRRWLPDPRHGAAMLSVNEELPDLLSHRTGVLYHRQLGTVHRTLL